jgi:hypothetical protein
MAVKTLQKQVAAIFSIRKFTRAAGEKMKISGFDNGLSFNDSTVPASQAHIAFSPPWEQPAPT